MILNDIRYFTHEIYNVFNTAYKDITSLSFAIQKKTYTITITPDDIDGGFVGACDELHAFSQGETFGEIMENIKEAVELAAEDIGNTSNFNMLIIQK